MTYERIISLLNQLFLFPLIKSNILYIKKIGSLSVCGGNFSFEVCLLINMMQILNNYQFLYFEYDITQYNNLKYTNILV